MKLSLSSVFRRGVRRERRLGWPIARSYSPNWDGHEEAQKGTKGRHSICHVAGWSPTGLLCFFEPFCGEFPDASGPKFLRIPLRPTQRMGRPV